MKTIKLENGQEVQISDESYKALQAGVQSTRWRAEYGEIFWFCNGRGITDWSYDTRHTFCSQRHEIGNYFWSKEEAENSRFSYRYQKAYQTILDDVNRAWGGEKIDWEDRKQGKWEVGFNWVDKDFWLNLVLGENLQSQGAIYFPTRESAQQSTEIHKEEWKIIMNIK